MVLVAITQNGDTGVSISLVVPAPAELLLPLRNGVVVAGELVCSGTLTEIPDDALTALLAALKTSPSPEPLVELAIKAIEQKLAA